MPELERFSVHLGREQFEALKRLQALCGHKTVEETIHKALQLYDVSGRFTARPIGEAEGGGDADN